VTSVSSSDARVRAEAFRAGFDMASISACDAEIAQFSLPPAAVSAWYLSTMHFKLVDQFLELTDTSAVAIKNVTAAEEYLQDHFPGFPVLPGVFMIEALTQAARAVLEKRGLARMVLGEVKALRYGSFVRPGETLRVEVSLEKMKEDGSFVFKAQGTVQKGLAGVDATVETAVSGRLILRPLRNQAVGATPDQKGASSPMGAEV